MHVEGVGKTNYSQFFPYQSSDVAEHEQLYHNVTTAFSNVFLWIESMVSITLVYVLAFLNGSIVIA